MYNLLTLVQSFDRTQLIVFFMLSIVFVYFVIRFSGKSKQIEKKPVADDPGSRIDEFEQYAEESDLDECDGTTIEEENLEDFNEGGEPHKQLDKATGTEDDKDKKKNENDKDVKEMDEDTLSMEENNDGNDREDETLLATPQVEVMQPRCLFSRESHA